MAKAKASKEAPSTRVRGKSAPPPGAPKKVIKKDKKSEKKVSKRKPALREPKSKEVSKKEKQAKVESQTTKPNKTQEKKRHNEKNLKEMEKQAGKEHKKHKKEGKEKESKGKKQTGKAAAKVPSSGAPVTPVRNNKALQSSEAGSSETPRSLDNLSDVEKEAEKAKAKGISLADHMENMSAQALEEHMQKLVKEQEHDGDEESEESEEEEDAPQSEDEMSGVDSEEDDDKEDEEKEEDEEKVKALQILGPCPENKSEDEENESENSSDDSSDSDSSSEDETKDEETTKGTKKEAEMRALVAVSNEAETAGKKSLANSTTNKAEWDKFSRQCLDKKKFPVELATHFLKDKEIWYYVGQGSEVTKSTEVKDSTGIEIRDNKPNADLVTALTSEEGPLAAGAMPKMGKVSEGGEKALTESLTNGTTQKVAAKKKKSTKNNKEDSAEELSPKTPLDKASESKTDILKSATEARKYALALEHVKYSGELVKGLMTFSTKMEQVYKKITSLVEQGVTDQDRYQKILDIITAQMTWYKQAEAAAKGLQNGLTKKPKKGKDKEPEAKEAES